MDLIQPEIPKKQEQLSGWVEQFSDALFSWAFHKTSDQAMAEDLVQDTFLAALKSIDKFKEKSSPKTWLFAILNKKIIDFYRKEGRNAVFNSSSLGNKGGNGRMENPFDKFGNWKEDHKPKDWDLEDGQIFDNVEFNHTLKTCMHKLPTKWFSTIQLKYLEGKEGQQICQLLGISTTNYWQILHRAKLQLRNCLEHNWFN